jgi:hypothetical protein
MFEQRLEETRQAIERYQTLEKELLGSLEYLAACHQCRPPRTTQEDCPHCPEDHGMKVEPALVAGFHSDPRQNGGITIPIAQENV